MAKDGVPCICLLDLLAVLVLVHDAVELAAIVLFTSDTED